MTALCIPPLLADHDVSGGTHVRTLPLLLDTGDAITSATMSAIDALGQPISGDSLRIVADAAGASTVLPRGLISADTAGDLWGVNFYLLDGTANTTYTLQLRYFLASQPGVPQYDELYRVNAVP